MSGTTVYDDSGTIIEQWDDTTRMYTDYRPDPDESRPYTAEENAKADAATQAAAQQANAAQVTSDLDQALIDIQVVIDTPNQTIKDNPAPYIKDIAHIVKKLIRKVNKSYESAS